MEVDQILGRERVMAAFERMKALERYLDECQELGNFQEILQQQCQQVVKELGAMASLELEAAAPLLAMVRQNRLWTNDMKEAISQALHTKVTESLGAGKVIASRMPMQDFSWFPVYLTQKDWDIVLQADTSANVGLKCNVVCDRLWKLGLRAPSEPTYAMITAILLLREPMRFSDGIQLRSSYLTVKQLVKNCLKAKSDEKTGDECYKTLPPMPTSLAEETYKRVFPEGDGPVALPKGLSIGYLKELQAMVPARSYNKKLQMPLQFPKAVPWGCSAPAQFAHGGCQPLMLTYANPHGHVGPLATPAQLALPAPSLAPPALPALPAPVAVPVAVEAACSVTELPQQGQADAKAICDIEVVPKPKEPVSTPKKTLALTDAKPDAAPTQEPKPSVEVAKRLEDALSTRDLEKKEKSSEAKVDKTMPQDQKQDPPDKKAKAKSTGMKVMKRPASAMAQSSSQAASNADKKSSKNSSKNSSKDATKTADSKSKSKVKKIIKKNCKGVINNKNRFKLSPKGCSRCRFVKGCCDSCWTQKGYRVA